MSYTRSWDDTTPTGGSQASTIDDSIRALKVDIHERMDELVDGWVTGPLTLKTPDQTIKDVIAARSMTIGPHMGQVIGGSPVSHTVDQYSIDGAASYIIPLLLPATAVITMIEYIVSRGGGLDITCMLKRMPYGPSTSPGIVQLSNTAGAGVQIVNSGTISVVIDAAHFFFQIDGDGTNTFSFRMLKLIYHVSPYYG